MKPHRILLSSGPALVIFLAACSRQDPPPTADAPKPAATNETAAVPAMNDRTPGDISWSQLPPSIQSAAQAEVNPDDVRHIERQVEEDRVRVVIQASSKGVDKTLTADVSGASPSADTLITWKQLPAPVQAALQKHVAITDVRRVDRVEEEPGKVKFTIQAIVRGLEHAFTRDASGVPPAAPVSLSWNELPKDIQSAFEKEASLPDLRKIEKIAVEGSTNYVADLHVQGLQKILTHSDPSTADNILCWNEVPKPVQASLQKELKPGDIQKIERFPEEGKTNHVAEAYIGGVRKIVSFAKPVPAGTPDNATTWNQLPKAIQTSLQKDLKPGDIQKIEIEENSRYVAYAFANGIGKIITVPMTGQVARADAVIAWNELPKPVQTAFQKQVKPADVSRVEKVLDAEGRPTYSAHARVGNIERTLNAGSFGEMTPADSLTTWNQLPKAVQAALQKEVRPPDIRTIEKPAEGGAPVYTVTEVVDGCEQSVRLGLYGELPQTDGVIAWSQLPPPVQAAAQKAVDPANLRKVEKPAEGVPFYVFSSTVNGLDVVCHLSPSGPVPPADGLLSWSQLPPPVQLAIQKETKPRDIRKIERGGEDPDIRFAIQSVDGRLVNSLTFASDGKLVAADRELSWSSLPAPAQAAVQEQVKPSSVTRIRKIQEADAAPTYEVRATFSGVEKAIILDDEGKLLRVEAIAE